MNVVATKTAWDLIGFDGSAFSAFGPDHPDVRAAYEAGEVVTDTPYLVRIKGGRTLYESVDNNGGEKVRLSRLAAGERFYGSSLPPLRAVTRYVDADTELEVIKED